MCKLISTVCLFFSIFFLRAQLTLSNNLRLTGAVFLNVDGDFDATGGIIDFDSDDPEIHISGAPTSFGTLDNAQGVIVLDGSSSQNLSEAETFWKLRVNIAKNYMITCYAANYLIVVIHQFQYIAYTK